MGASPYYDLPGTRRTIVPVDVVAASASTLFALLRAPDAITVESVRYTAGIAHTGDAVNTKNVNLQTRNSTFGAAVEVATRDYAAGTNDAAGDLVNLDTTERDIASGAFLAVQIEQVGAGIRFVASFIIDWRGQE